MDFRTKRQLAIIGIVLVVILVPAGLLFYFYSPQSTCEDTKQNQGEEEPDCGGPCVPCALKHPQDLSVFWVRFVPVRENVYDVAAEVRNSNVKLGAYSFEYEFRFFDDAGVLVATRRGTSFAFPAETVHIVEPNVETLRTLARVTLSTKNPQWVFTSLLPLDVVVGDTLLKADSQRKESTLTATVVNRTLSSIRSVIFTALVQDMQGNVVAVSKSTEDFLLSGEARNIFFSWPRIVPSDGATLFVEPRVNTLPAKTL